MNLSNYKAVILAGGKGTRLYPITKEIPKPLLPINRKPIINYLIDLFQEQGIKEIAVLISKDFREDFEWWKKRYFPSAGSGRISKIKLVEEQKPLGTFGGLFLLKHWLGDRPFFLTNGDELKEIDLLEMSRFHQKTGSLATIALVEVPDPQNYGVVLCQSGIIKEFLEKPQNPPSNYINSGLYLLSPDIFNHPVCRSTRAGRFVGRREPKFLMTEIDLFPRLAKEGKLFACKFKGKWTDCGTWERYSRALKDWK